MPKLKNIVVIHTTSNVPEAESNADFSLEISRPGDDVVIPFPRNPNQRGKGKLDVYHLDVSQHDVDSQGPGFSLIMTIETGAGWLPLSIFVLGRTVDDELTLLGSHPFWGGDRWFDSGSDAVPGSQPAYEISSREPYFPAG